jgi:Phage integrase, N-terminal SAM-like domain
LDETRETACTFTEFAAGWLKYVAAQRKPGTSEKYEMILRKYWFPALGRLPVTAVSRDHIKTVLGEKLSAEFKPKTVRGHLDVLRACFSETNLGIIRSSSWSIKLMVDTYGHLVPGATRHPWTGSTTPPDATSTQPVSQ